LWQVLWGEDRIPSRNLELGQTSLFGGWQVIDHVGALWTRNCHGPDRPRLDLGDDRREGGASEVNLASDHIVDCRTGTAVGNTRGLGAHDHMQQSARGVHLPSSTAMGLVHFILVLSYVVDALIEIVGREIFSCNDYDRRAGRTTNRREILPGII